MPCVAADFCLVSNVRVPRHWFLRSGNGWRGLRVRNVGSVGVLRHGLLYTGFLGGALVEEVGLGLGFVLLRCCVQAGLLAVVQEAEEAHSDQAHRACDNAWKSTRV